VPSGLCIPEYTWPPAGPSFCSNGTASSPRPASCRAVSRAAFNESTWTCVSSMLSQLWTRTGVSPATT